MNWRRYPQTGYPRAMPVDVEWWFMNDASLSLEESAVLFRLLLRAWQSADPPCALDAQRRQALINFSGLSGRRWNRIGRPLLERFFQPLSSPYVRNAAQYAHWVRLTKPPKKALRRGIIDASNARCYYCGTTTGPFHLDHMTPRIRGGGDEPSNLTLACVRCNLSKGGLTAEEFIQTRETGVRPNWRSLATRSRLTEGH